MQYEKITFIAILLAAMTSCTQRYESYTDVAQVNGVELFYAAGGCGKPVILIHGNGGSHNDVETTRRELAQAGYMAMPLIPADREPTGLSRSITTRIWPPMYMNS